MRFEELDWADTDWGVISLRRRWDAVTQREVHEVKLDDDFLMSSQFTHGEEELSRLGLAAVTGEASRVLVGGLGLGYTARAALEDPRVAELTVVEALQRVIDWHEQDLFADTRGLAADPRVRLVRDDFFDLVRAGRGGPAYDAVLVDIDHAPDWLLRPDHGDLYTDDGLTALASLVRPGGVFALWSDEDPDPTLLDRLRSVFGAAEGHAVRFANPLTGGESGNGVYVAVRAER